jgi:hypothetical protein
MYTRTVVFVVFILIGGSNTVYCGEVSEARKTFDTWCADLRIDKRWDDLPQMPDHIKRHRGALAHVYHRIQSGDIPEEILTRLYLDLGNLLASVTSEDVHGSKHSFSDYQSYFKIDVFELWKLLITGATAPDRWGSKFIEIYFDQAGGDGVPFDVHLPADTGLDAYPLLVTLGRGPTVPPFPKYPFIQVRPSRGGIWGYRSISAYDVIKVIDFMNRHYPVDSDRIYLAGFSAGASGAMHLASQYPDLFAAVLPMVAVGNNYPLVNFKNLPVAIHHGTDDWTSSICNARVQYEKFKDVGCPVELHEYASVGHSVPKPHHAILDWLLDQSLKRSPLSVTHECEAPSLGKSYWIHIREFQDPHQRAFVSASVLSSKGKRVVAMDARNVSRLSIDFGMIPGGNGSLSAIEFNGSRISAVGATGRFDCQLQDGRWQLEDQADEVSRTTRLYEAGAAANLYQGESLLVVYGTGSDDAEHIEKLKTAAEKLATYGGPMFTPLRDGFPVVADTAITREQEENCNLILIGTPGQNRLTRTILPDLPIVIENDALSVDGRSDLPLRNQVLSLLHPNPGHPLRLVYLIAPFADEIGFDAFCEAPQSFLVGSEGFDRVSQADLVVQTLDNRISRQMQFGKNWRWMHSPGSDRHISGRFEERSNLAMTHLEIMKRKSDADFAIWWGPEDKGMWGYDFNFLRQFNPEYYTLADFRTQHQRIETMTGGVPGSEMKDLWTRWGLNRELVIFPDIQIDALGDQKLYRIHIPMDLYIKLGQRKKTLVSPKEGPVITSDELIGEILE